MSSHHIIRDQQEPALLIKHLDHFPQSILHQLLEWLPTVICCEESINLYSSLTHKLDVAMVSFQNVGHWENELANQLPIRIVGVEPDLQMSSAFGILQKGNHQAVNIITNDLSLFEVIRDALRWIHQFEIVIFTESARHVIQKRLSFTKWLPSFSKLSIMPLSERSCFTTSGFDADLEEEGLKEGITLNKRREGEVTIKSNRVPYLISEEM